MALGYITIRSPYIPYSIYLRGTILGLWILQVYPLNPRYYIPICPYITLCECGSMPNAASNRLAKMEFSATAGGSESLEALRFRGLGFRA